MDSNILNMENSEEKKKIIVSDDFIETYKYLNADDMTESISNLSEFETYILVALSLDNHDMQNTIVRNNLLPLKDIGQALYDAMEDISTNKIIDQLIEQTGDKYIDLSVLVDSDGNNIPDPATAAEIRDYKLRFID